MPTEDALVLITRNFDAYMRGEKAGQNPLGTGVNALSDRHPEAVQVKLYFTLALCITVKM